MQPLPSFFFVVMPTNLLFPALLVAQKNKKEEAANQRALTDAIRSEQRIEEINGFYKRKLPGTSNLS